ncbi:MAG: inorganic pyrophosphatase [Acutalibacteraceae bacterium]
MIGETVKVTVDRQLGSVHPKHKNLRYPVNYGYVNGIIAPDGEEQDAYIIGINNPVNEFVGKVIAIIHRYDDIEEKWVVAPENAHFTKEQIKSLVYFQEKYFDSEIIM